MKITINKPLITEKYLKDAQKGIYTFIVSKNSDKKGIKEAIERLFNVHVVSLTTLISKGKTKIVGKKRVPVKQSDRKKARVILKKGEKIELFEVAGEKWE